MSIRVVEKEFGELAMNMGPQHPSTHGVLRLILHLRGETIVKAEPVIGYLHRGVEKLSEELGYDQLAPIFERDDYLSPTANSFAYILAVEEAAGIDVPPRAHYLRSLMAELQRISSHLVWLGTFGLDLGGALGGGTTVFMYCFREREKLMDIFETWTGTRFHTNFNVAGGVRYDLDTNLADSIRKTVDEIQTALDEILGLTRETPVFLERTRGVGVIPEDLALSVGVTGPVLRASGVAMDIRKTNPYAAYKELDFNIPVQKSGDVLARFDVRIAEIRESVRLVHQILDRMPDGPIFSRKPIKNPKVFRIPEKEVYRAVESPRGELGIYLVSDGTFKPYRLKINAPSFANLQIIPHILPGHLVADVVAILGSLDPVLGDVDR